MKNLKKLGILILLVLVSCSKDNDPAQPPNSYFITTWKTTTADESITIPTNSDETYNYTVDWGDGVTTTETSDATHTYATPGTHTVKISGTFPHLNFQNSNSNNREKLLSVENWGDIEWKSMYYAFFGCSNLRINATDAPDLSNVTNMNNMFQKAASFNQSINHWDVSNVTNMEGLFSYATSFNQPLNNWEVSKVNNMGYMFLYASYFNQPLNNWDVSNTNFMTAMFNNASSFNQPLMDWEVSNVTSMNSMFLNASSFNQPVGNWDVSKVTDMNNMFRSASSFNQPLNSWDLSNVFEMISMFRDATSFNQPLNEWNLSGLGDETMTNMFTGVTLSTANYDATLLGWADNANTPNNVIFHGGNSTYCNETARSTLTVKGWDITDGGKDTSCP